jgi:predicted HicB family RNase H-like nuclease
LNSAFKEAVEDYIDLCMETGKEAFKTFKGSFNIRIQPELHSKIYVQSLLEGKTLNQFVKEEIEEKVNFRQVLQ